ncbi:hypothetical protein [Candidatus Ichthyocystis sparus]|uniref:hypothetical protein n=1 Tax=Candidatus Ichthyocystis sparus TaxID=1561004 RepID=UPI000B2D4080|nr:hypothetical protein [Candidatus Ichthyocystis sparus]
MKRKLSSSSNEANSPEVGYVQGCLGEQEQSSSVLELEQSTGSAEVGGFLLAPHLSQALGMHPSEMLFRSMFYGTPQASRISDLITELLIEHEDLLCRVMGEGTGSILLGGGACSIALVDSSAATIQALIDSIEAPLSVVVPSEAVEGVGTVTNGQALGVPEVVAVAGVGDATYEQATSAPEQSNRYSCVGFVLPPDLALKLGMYPGQVLCRSMFYDTPQSDIVLDVVGQISEAQECLLRDQELERSGVVDQVSRVGYGNTDALIAANEELLQALMDSIESPLLTAVPPVIAVSSSSEEMSDEVERDRSIEVENERVLEIAREEMAEMERERLRVIAEIEARKREKDHVKVENVEREIQGRIDAREERARRVEIDVQERREAREAREAKARRIEQEMRGEDIEEERELVSRLEEELAKARAERLARAEIALRAEQEAKAEKEREKERERERKKAEKEKEKVEKAERKKEKEREKAEKEREKERKKAEKEREKERKKAEKERESRERAEREEA